MIPLLWLACVQPPDRTLVLVTLDGTETSTSITPPNSSRRAPRIDEMDVTELPGEIEVRLELSAGGASVSGGVVSVALDGDAQDLAIPDDLSSWDGEIARFTIPRPMVGACSLGADHALEVAVVDSSGRSSAVEEMSVPTTAVGTIVDELNDTEITVLGSWSSGDLVCGVLDSTGNDGVTYTADRDAIAFDVEASGQRSLSLDWTVDGDYDLWLYEIDASGAADPLKDAAHPGVDGPEVMTANLSRTQQYLVEVVGWDGDAGAWTLELQ